MNPIALALIYGLMVAGLTSLGALFAILGPRLAERSVDVGLGFAAGVMLVASFTSLILPAMEKGLYVSVGLGIALGVAAIALLDKVVPHEHVVTGYEGFESLRGRLRKAWLLALAMIIHNIPEGFAIGVTTAYSPPLGLATAIAIGVQDIPEGIAVSLPLASAERRVLRPLLVGVVSGVAEAVAAVLGAAAFTYVKAMLGLGMGLAGGAMIYVTVEEILPEIFGGGARGGRERLAITISFLLGMYLMLYLDVLLGGSRGAG